MGHIVVGVDGSTGAAAALRWAAREGQASTAVSDQPRAHLLALHGPGEWQFDPHYGVVEDARAALRAYVEPALEPAAAVADRHVVCDLAARALLDEAANADLLVLGGSR